MRFSGSSQPSFCCRSRRFFFLAANCLENDELSLPSGVSSVANCLSLTFTRLGLVLLFEDCADADEPSEKARVAEKGERTLLLSRDACETFDTVLAATPPTLLKPAMLLLGHSSSSGTFSF